MSASGTPTYAHQDQLGSIRALTDGSGAVVRTADYDAYGQPVSTTGSTSMPFGYAGEYTDAETGFLYLRARYYDPTTGSPVVVVVYRWGPVVYDVNK